MENDKYIEGEMKQYVLILGNLSDLQFQRDVWLDCKYPDRIFNFGEAVNTLEDYNFFERVECRELDLTEAEYLAVCDFSRSLFSYDEPVSDIGRMFNDKEWMVIVEQARCVKENFVRLSEKKEKLR